MRYEIIMWIMWFLKVLPGHIGCILRRMFLPGRIARGAKIWDNVQIDAPSKLTVGARSSINRGCVLNCGGHVEIKEDVLIGPNVIIYSQNHVYADAAQLIAAQGYDRAKVIIEEDVWIGANAVILPGVTVARGCVVGAASVVTKSTDPYGVYVGSPASRISERTIAPAALDQNPGTGR